MWLKPEDLLFVFQRKYIIPVNIVIQKVLFSEVVSFEFFELQKDQRLENLLK